MRNIILSILIFYSVNISAKDIIAYPDADISPLQISQMFDEKIVLNTSNFQDLVIKEEKINVCMFTYIEKQKRSFAKITQNNLYDLINSFDRIISKIYNKKPNIDNISYEEKIEALARVQCETYFYMNILK